MKFCKLISTLVLLTLMTLSAAAQQNQAPAQPNGGGVPAGALPVLVIDSFTHDFGEVKPGEPLSFAFKIRNEGKADLLINDVTPGCGCTKGDYDKVIAPGKEGKIALTVAHTEGYAGEVSKAASVLTNDPKNARFNLLLRARFKTDSPAPALVAAPLNPNPVFTVEPGERMTTSVLVGGTSSNTFYLYNPQSKPIHVKSIGSGGDDFSARIETLQDGKRYQLTIASNPSLKPGHYLQTIKALTDSPAQPVISIEMDLTVYPKVFASPTSIIMPTLPASGDLAPINWPMIYVRRLRETGLQIKSYTSTLPFLKLELLTETENQVYKIKLTLDSTKIKPGEFKGKVRVETNDLNVPFIEIPIQVSFK